MEHEHHNHQSETHEEHKHNQHHNHSNHSHNHHEGHDHGAMDHSAHGGDFKKKFFVSLFLGIPIILIAPMMGIELPFQFTFPGSEWVVLILGTILFFYGGMPFLKGAKMELEMKNPGMMMLISLGI